MSPRANRPIKLQHYFDNPLGFMKWSSIMYVSTTMWQFLALWFVIRKAWNWGGMFLIQGLLLEGIYNYLEMKCVAFWIRWLWYWWCGSGSSITISFLKYNRPMHRCVKFEGFSSHLSRSWPDVMLDRNNQPYPSNTCILLYYSSHSRTMAPC